jgi:Holliday junction resolvase RusA-like endonuclease
MVVLDLPFPPSANRLTRHAAKSGKLLSYTDPDYRSWKADAYGEYLRQKKNAGSPVKGAFTYHLILDETRWPKASDGDNRGKAVLDFIQSVGLIENDKYAASGGWSWGPVTGARITVHPIDHARIKVSSTATSSTSK